MGLLTRNRQHALRITFYVLHIKVAGAHGAQRAAIADEAVLGALAWVDKGPPRAGLILAWVGRQAVVDALLDDQGVQIPVELTQR